MSVDRVVLAKVVEAGSPSGRAVGRAVAKLTLEVTPDEARWFAEYLYRHVAIRVVDLKEAFKLEKTP